MKKLFAALLAILLMLNTGCAFFNDSANQADSPVSPHQSETTVADEPNITESAPDGSGLNTESHPHNYHPNGVQAETAVLDAQSVSKDPLPEADDTKPAQRIPVVVYFQDNDQYLIPVTYRIELQEGVARASVNSLIYTEEMSKQLAYYGLNPILPAETEILGLNLVDGIATIDFNNNFLNFENEKKEKNAIASIVYTLTEFENIQAVKILINGYEKGKLEHGTDISGVIERSDIYINSGSQSNSGYRDGSNKLDVYFLKDANATFTYLLPMSVKADATIGGDVTVEALVQFLLKTQAYSKLRSEIPEKSALLNCSTKNDLLILDFNRAFTNYGGNSREEAILLQLLHTVKQHPGINKVKILIENESTALPEGTDSSNGLTLPLYINDVFGN